VVGSRLHVSTVYAVVLTSCVRENVYVIHMYVHEESGGLDSHMKLPLRNIEKIFKTEFSVPT